MADSQSGAGQIMEIDSTSVSGTAHDFGGLTLDFDPSTFTSETGGVQKTLNAGTIALTGSFTVGETETTNGVLLGQNGARKTIRWRKAAGVAGLQLTAILTVSRTFAPRGGRGFSVDVQIDGAPTAWAA